MDFLVTSFGGKNSREIMVDAATIAGSDAIISGATYTLFNIYG